ncbi:hypothetical protein GCM10010195_08490 [Kitasatospora griseola]|nr:hypothetical protein GCM10010195_08490 [Kitasatospora griseola]
MLDTLGMVWSVPDARSEPERCGAVLAGINKGAAHAPAGMAARVALATSRADASQSG